MAADISFLLGAGDPTSHILPHDLFRVGHVMVTNQMLMALVSAILMLAIFPYLFRKSSDDAPAGARNFFEAILEFMRSEVFRPALKDKTDRFVPFLWTLFFFILFCNVLGLIPTGSILGLIGWGFSHQAAGALSEYGGTATGNINTTGALALCALFMIHFSGVVQIARDLIDGTYGRHEHHDAKGHEQAGHIEHPRGEGLPGEGADHARGHGGGMNPVAAAAVAVPLYLWNFAPHTFRPEPGQTKLLWIADILVFGMLLVLELIGAVIKPFALMIRLFANMIAGHLVLAVLTGLIVIAPSIAMQIGIGIPVTILGLLMSCLELFVAFLQAYIFVFLTTLFIASAVAPEH